MKKHIYLYLSAIIASLGGFLCGYDTGVISGALLYINNEFNLTPTEMGFIVSAVSVGAIIGAFLNNFITDKIGRKKTYIITALIFISGCIFCFLANSIKELIFSRLFLGCAVGIASFIGPLYLSEISTKEKRGQIVSFHQLSITFGIFCSYLFNYFCALYFNQNWRLMLLIGVFPAIILFIGMFFIGETPRWLVLNNRIDEAEKQLNLIDDKQDNKIIIKEIKKLTTNKEEKITFKKSLLKPVLIGFTMMFIQIATGINAIIYYSPTILKTIGLTNDNNILLATILIGFVNFIMTFVAIATIDKLGRKPLLYIGLTGMTISLTILSLSCNITNDIAKIFAILSCITYIISFAISLGPVALLLISEIFPLNLRSKIMSFAIIFNFLTNFAVTTIFPILLDKIGASLTFALFIFICIISIIFVYKYVIETKGISLEEIEKHFA